MTNSTKCRRCGCVQIATDSDCLRCGSPLFARGTNTLLPGTILAERYEILHLVGKGGMGSVYLATDNRIEGRLVAVKLNQETDDRAVSQFKTEAKVLAALHHPGLPTVTDHFFEPNGCQYMVMDYVDGDTLEDIVEQHGPFPETEAIALSVELLEIVEYLHAHGVIHRDIKPANIKRTLDNKLFLVDFGIAKISIDYKVAITEPWLKGRVSSGFAPLEQYTGGTDNQSDIYSIGAVLYFLVTGQVPPTAFDLAGGSSSAPSSQVSGQISSNIDQLVQKAMAVQPSDRFQTTAEMRQALLQIGSRKQANLSVGRDLSSSWKMRLRPVQAWLTARNLAILASIGIGVLALLCAVWDLVPRHLLGLEPGFLSLVDKWELIAILLLLGGISIAAVLQRRNSVKAKNDFDVNSKTGSDRPGVQSGYKTARMAATDLRPVLDDWIQSDNRKVIEELVLHEDFESLKAWIANASGERWLLMGYGRFGGTSLVKGAIQRATRELKVQGNGNVLVLYFDVAERANQMQRFEVEANEIYLGTLTTADQTAVSNGKPVNRRPRGAADFSKTYRFSLARSIDRSFLNWAPSVYQLLRKHRYDFSELVVDLQSLTESNRSSNDLRKITARLLGSSELPSRVIVILDRIRHLETLEELSRSTLFSSEKLSVVAVARKEEVDAWVNSAERLRSINFKQWVIPCIWRTDLISQAVNVLLQPFGRPTATAERNLGILCDHLAYVGRSSLGRVLEELRPNQRPWYWKTDNEGKYFLQLDPLPHEFEIEQNAWKQAMLQKNWATIVPHYYARTHLLLDQARIGVYYLMDWIDQQTSFTLDEIWAAAAAMPITISNTESIRQEILTRLLYVLKAKAHQYLRLMDGCYVVQGVDPNSQEPRQVRYRRVKSSVTVEQQQVRFRRDDLQLDIIVEEVTDTSTPRIPQKEQQAERQIKILAVFAKPKGSDEGRLGEEERTINECVTQCQQRDNLRLRPLPAARVRDLQLALMEDDYQVVHFSGYATETGELQFEDSNGEAKPVRKEALAELLRLCSSIECVILNAHYTLSQGQLIASGVSYTIAMDGPISHEASRAFVRGFYDAIGSGKGYVDAFGQGRVALNLDGFSSEEIAIPQLL